MSDRFVEVQKALHSRVATATLLQTFDHVPQDQPPPFAVIGDDTANPHDTKTANGVEHALQVHLYSAERGQTEIKHYMSLIYEDLQRQAIAVVGFFASPPQFDFSDTFAEPDGYRGVMRFRLFTTPE